MGVMLHKTRTLSLWFFANLMLVGCAAKPPVISYATPEDTFKTWHAAVGRLDLVTVVASYAESAQPKLRKEIAATSLEGLKAMQMETKNTDFEIEKVVYEENHAFLRVLRKIRDESEVEVINMIKEPGGWKLLP